MSSYQAARGDVPQELRDYANFIVFNVIKAYYEAVKTGTVKPIMMTQSDGTKKAWTADVMAYDLAKIARREKQKEADAKRLEELKIFLDELATEVAPVLVKASIVTGVTGVLAAAAGGGTNALGILCIGGVLLAAGTLAAAPQFVDKDKLADLIESHFTAELSLFDRGRLVYQDQKYGVRNPNSSGQLATIVFGGIPRVGPEKKKQ